MTDTVTHDAFGTGCLRDLRKLWSRDDEDPSRRIARIYAEVNLIKNDLLPILLATAGKGERGNKIALACSEYEL